MKKFTKSTLLVLSILVLTLTSYSCSRSKKSKVIIKGSTTVLPIAQKTAEYFMKISEVKISISGTGSGDGINSIISGHCDIANSSRDMKEKEKAKAKAKGIQVEGIVVAHDMIVPVVHPSNSLKNITLDQLKAIYDGSIKNWKQLGGADKKIVVVSRDTSSGTYEVWHKLVMKKKKVRKDSLLQASNGSIVSVVSQNPNAIGYIGFGYMSNNVKPLMVNGIVPNLENGKSGVYEISRKLFMFINKATISKNAKAYIDFIQSREGQILVKEAGFISL